ncbi:MAG: hypothetical protein IPG78_00105 [Ignavibacteria bacterium]|nr:hypothetical protein [Ignavibacteria bacterium]
MKFFYLSCLAITFIISACSASNDRSDKSEENNKPGSIENTESYSSVFNKINKTAEEEQLNPMYSISEDTTFLYWLGNQIITLNNSTKCNIFALNVLYKAGFKCPEINTLTYDLMDTSRFKDIFPLINFEDETDLVNKIRPGDLIIWNGHVIIFESLEKIKERLYAVAWWAGTRQEDNGENIINNVIHGKYPLDGNFIVRRPVASE